MIMKEIKVVTVHQALEKLVAAGYNIEQIEPDKFMVTDNGKFGFVTDEDPFIVDGNGVLEIFNMYL